MINDKIQKWVFSLELPQRCKAVLNAMLAYADWKKRTCYPGSSRLSLDTGYCERTVRKALNELNTKKYLMLVHAGCRGDGNGRGRLANKYRINVPEEILPPKYQTNWHSLPEGQRGNGAGLSGNCMGANGNHRHDQPAIVTSQDTHGKIPTNQDSLSYESGSAEAKLIFENEVLRMAREANVSDSVAVAAIKEHGTIRVVHTLVKISTWTQTASMNAAFKKALKPHDSSNNPSWAQIPKDMNAWPFWAVKHGYCKDVSTALMGMNEQESRRWLEAQIKERKKQIRGTE